MKINSFKLKLSPLVKQIISKYRSGNYLSTQIKGEQFPSESINLSWSLRVNYTLSVIPHETHHFPLTITFCIAQPWACPWLKFCNYDIIQSSKWFGTKLVDLAIQRNNKVETNPHMHITKMYAQYLNRKSQKLSPQILKIVTQTFSKTQFKLPWNPMLKFWTYILMMKKIDIHFVPKSKFHNFIIQLPLFVQHGESQVRKPNRNPIFDISPTTIKRLSCCLI